MTWRVLVHNDAINSFAAVAYALVRVLSMPVEHAAAAARQAYESGVAEIGAYTEREPAEAITARLQAFGLNASIEVAA
ncbi:ATP-dependent Clp protease adaptor ClpS [Kutzneria albida]|uniref:Adaptor protein ClpS core domain-containing protein n=1 Tax=Kutzneria albida DSM 43870 TaxID=1449976 RepID=W5W1I1_9PSEU|nr:ATP-dependent Clp protease adaptor ClpS [Kutzneria albida]AHH94620.1 hypothetical protein KALB_1247 [Kutzneria albida DSM 43870]